MCGGLEEVEEICPTVPAYGFICQSLALGFKLNFRAPVDIFSLRVELRLPELYFENMI